MSLEWLLTALAVQNASNGGSGAITEPVTEKDKQYQCCIGENGGNDNKIQCQGAQKTPPPATECQEAARSWESTGVDHHGFFGEVITWR